MEKNEYIVEISVIDTVWVLVAIPTTLARLARRNRAAVRGKPSMMDLFPKTKAIIVIDDEDVGQVTDTIVANSATGEMGNNKMFASPVVQIVHVRVGDNSHMAR